MLDIKLIRENADGVKKSLATRGAQVEFGELLGWDEERRKTITEMETLREKRNKASEQFGKFKREGKEIPAEVTGEINAVGDAIKDKDKVIQELEGKIENFLLCIPNMPDPGVPVGKCADENVIARQDGDPGKFDFPPKAHWEIGEKLGILDFATAAKLSGSRFSLLRADGCVLERALISFMLDTHRAKGYQEILAPYLVSRTSMRGTGQLPKFEEDLFKTTGDEELFLIPTAEVSVTNIVRDEMMDEKTLPRYFVSYSACFRRESGSYGKDTKGLIRNHQFNKIELVKVVKPEDSMQELEKLTADAAEVLHLLGIPNRVVALCTGDMGFGSAKTYDLEVWMPGENRWREISSCSNYKDFQARRLNAKVKYADKRKEFVHTLNGSGVAVGRAFAAILENYQQKDGSVVVPEVLRKYTGFDRITKK